MISQELFIFRGKPCWVRVSRVMPKPTLILGFKGMYYIFIQANMFFLLFHKYCTGLRTHLKILEFNNAF